MALMTRSGVIVGKGLLVCLAGLLLSCGGGGGGGGSSPSQGDLTTLPATGKVTLPAGFKDSMTSLSVESGFDQQPVSANGTFKLQVAGPGETLVNLVDSKGNIVMMGFADGGSAGSPEAGGKGQISAATTTTALIFYGLSGYTMAPTLWPQLRALIRTTTQQSSAANIVSSRLAANPLAISANDSQLNSAISQAITGIGGADIATTQDRAVPNQAPPATINVSVTKRSSSSKATDTDILIQPGTEQSGVEVLNNPDGDGIQLVNHYRRRVAAYIYETSVTLTGDTATTNLTTLIPVGSPVLGSTTGEFATTLQLGIDPSHFIEVSPANGLHGTIGSLIDLLFHNGAMTPATTGPINLPLAPGTSRTNYTIVVLGPSWGNQNSLSAFDAGFDSRFSSYQSYWTNAVRLMSFEEMLLDIFMPMIASIPLSGFKVGTLDVEDALEIVNAASNVPDLVSSMENGQWSAAADSFIQSSADSSKLRLAIVKGLCDANFSNQTISTKLKQAQSYVEEFFELVDLVDLVLQTIDSSAVVYASTVYDTGDGWLGTVVQKVVRLTPSTATVTQSAQSAAFSVTPSNGTNPDKPFYFFYSVSGAAAGSLEDLTHNSGKDQSFYSQQDTVTFLPNLLAEDGSKATVTVSTYLNVGTADKPVAGDLVGTASSTVTDNINQVGPCTMFPSTITGGLNMTVSPSTIAPGETITIGVSGYTGTPTVSIGENNDMFVHSYSISGGSSHTWADDDPHGGPLQVTLPPSTGGGSCTITCTIDKVTPDQCPSLYQGKPELADLTGLWVVGFTNKGFTAVPVGVYGSPNGP